MRTLRRVVHDQPLILAWSGGATLTLLVVAWLLRPYFPVVVAFAFGVLVLGVLLTVRDLVHAEEAAETGAAAVAQRLSRLDAGLLDVGGRVRVAENARRELDELAERADRLEAVLSLLTRWPGDPATAPLTSTLLFGPADEPTAGTRGSPRDDLARFRDRRAAQERGRKRVERWRTQLGTGPDRLAIFVDVFWIPRAAATGGLPLLVARRTRMSAPAWPAPGESGRPPAEAFLVAMEERFADARSRREVAFWTAPAGTDLGRLVARLAADRDRWQDLADGLPAVVRDGDADRLGPAASAELEALVHATDAVRIVRYTALLEGVRTAAPVLRHASLVRAEGDPVAALVADAFVRTLDGMTPEPTDPAGPDVLIGGAAAAGLARWHGTEGLREDARSVLDQRRRRGSDAPRHAAAAGTPRRRARPGIPR